MNVFTKYILIFPILYLSRTTMFSLWHLSISLFHTPVRDSTENASDQITNHHHVTLPICLSLPIKSVMRFRRCFMVCLLPPLQSVLLPTTLLHALHTHPSFNLSFGSAPSHFILDLTVELLPTLPLFPD